jgi:hypothetical protein
MTKSKSSFKDDFDELGNYKKGKKNIDCLVFPFAMLVAK